MKARHLALGLAVLLPTFSFSPASAETIKIKVDKLLFSPAQVTAHVGDIIEWTNADFIDHTATAKNKAFDVKLPKGMTKSATVSKAGVIDYYCRLHPMMVGKITVE